MSVNSGADANGINGDYTRINWHPPGSERDDGASSKNATLALKTAIAVARAFDANCALRNPAKEGTIPMFESQELIIGEAFRNSGFFEDLALRGIKLTRNLQHGEFSEEEEEYRERFAERSIDGHYCVKVCKSVSVVRDNPLLALTALTNRANATCSMPLFLPLMLRMQLILMILFQCIVSSKRSI